MVYEEFLSAARKHNHTCQLLIKEIERLKEDGSPSCKGKLKALTLNLYYLAGYVIECSLKYGIYQGIGYDRKADIEKLASHGLTFKDNIQHHKFGRYQDCFVTHSNISVPLINPNASEQGISKQVKTLFKNWNAPLRYRYKCLFEYPHSNEYSYVLQFGQLAEEIFETIQNNR